MFHTPFMNVQEWNQPCCTSLARTLGSTDSSSDDILVIVGSRSIASSWSWNCRRIRIRKGRVLCSRVRSTWSWWASDTVSSRALCSNHIPPAPRPCSSRRCCHSGTVPASSTGSTALWAARKPILAGRSLAACSARNPTVCVVSIHSLSTIPAAAQIKLDVRKILLVKIVSYPRSIWLPIVSIQRETTKQKATIHQSQFKVSYLAVNDPQPY